jgi:hypothetical protein
MGDNLLCLMKDLQKRIEKLEKDTRELKKWANKERKKIDVIAWLNEHYLPTEDFPEWVKSMEFTESELEFVFHSGLERGIFTIIKQRMPLENRRHFPIIAFKHQLKSIFYVYEKDSWRKIKKGVFESMINSMDHKLLLAFNAWEINHPEMLCPANREIWGKKLKCILMPPEKTPRIIGRIEKSVHTYLALNLKNIVEYEFVF